MRRAARSDANQAKIVRDLRKAGYGVLDIHAIGHGAPDEIKHWLAIRKTEHDAGMDGQEATGRADADYLTTHTK